MEPKKVLLRPVSIEFPITQRFGENPELYPAAGGHNGIDFAVPEGTLVCAAADGTIRFADIDPATRLDTQEGYGWQVRITHPNRSLTLYAHLKEGSLLVKEGDPVRMGQGIALSGAGGRSGAPHLHFEYRAGLRQTPVDPEPLLVYMVPEERARRLIQLSAGNPEERLQAVEELAPYAAVDDEVRDALLKQQRLDENARVRDRIARALAGPDGEPVAPQTRPSDEEMGQLVQQLREGSPGERIQAVNRLAPFAPADADVRRLLWEQLVRENDPGTGEAVIRVLGPLAAGDAELRDYLLEFKTPDHPSLRMAVAEVLSPLAESDAGVRSSLLGRLREEQDPQVRATILGGLAPLAQSDREVRQALLARLQNDRAPMVRVTAVEALGRLAGSDPGVRQALQERLQDEEEVVIKAARDALNLPERTRLLAQMDGEDWKARLQAVQALGPQAGENEGVRRALIERTTDGRYQVRMAAVNALSALAADEQVFDALVACLDDRSSAVLDAVDAALVKRRTDPRVLQALLKRLSDKDVNLRASAVKTLGDLAQGNAAVKKALLERLEIDDNEIVRAAIVTVLAKLAESDSDVQQALLKCLDEPRTIVRQPATFALDFLAGENDNVRRALLEFFLHGENQARLAAAVALGGLVGSDPGVRQAFLDQAKKEFYWRVRRGIIEALGSLGENDVEARRAVEAALEDKSTYVRYYARMTLRGNEPDGDSLPTEQRERLLAELDSADAQIQRQAVQLLGPHARTVPVVRIALLSRLESARHAAVRPDIIAALAPLAQSDPEVARALELQLKDPNPDVREAAREALGAPEEPLGEETPPADKKEGPLPAADRSRLLGQLSSQNAEERAQAVNELSPYLEGDPELQQVFLERLRSEGDSKVREYIVEALGPLAQSEEAVRLGLLEGVAADGDEQVRAAIVGALGPLAQGSPDARAALLERMRNDENPVVRRHAVETLGGLANSEPAVRRLLLDSLGDSDAGVRGYAVVALGSLVLDDGKVRQALLGQLRQDNNLMVRVAAVKALGKAAQSDPEVRQALRERLTDSEQAVRNAVTRALREPKSAPAQPSVEDQAPGAAAEAPAPQASDRERSLGLLQDERWQARKQAVEDLAPQAEEDAEVRSALLELLNDKKLEVRRAAAAALAPLAVSDQSVRDALRESLSDKVAAVREQAAQALANTASSDEKVRSALLAVMTSEDEDVKVRLAASYALLPLANSDAEVKQALEETKESAQSIESSAAALSAEGRIWLLSQLNARDWQARQRAAQELGAYAQDGAVRQALLERLAQEKNIEVRRAAVFSLREFAGADQQVLQAFFDLLQSEKDVQARKYIVGALGALAPTDEAVRAALIASLSADADGYVREYAAQVLAPLVDEYEDVHDALRLRLEDEYGFVRTAARAALGNFAPGEMRTEQESEAAGERARLLWQANHGNVNERIRAMAALAPLAKDDDEIIQALIEQLSHQNIRVRRAAVIALEGLAQSHPTVRRELERLAQDGGLEVRNAALRALGREASGAITASTVQDSRELPSVDANRVRSLGLLQDERWQVRKQAVEDLAPLAEEDAEARSALLAVLRDKKYEVRKAAVRALGPLASGDEAVLYELVRAVGDRSAEVNSEANAALRRAVEDNPVLLDWIIAHMGEAGAGEINRLVMFLGQYVSHPRVQQALLMLLQEAEPSVRVTVAGVVSDLAQSDPAVREALLERLKTDEDAGVRLDILEYLREMVYTDRGIRQVLLQRLEADPDPALRRQVITALGSLAQRDPDARQALLERLRRDEDPGVRVFAARSLAPLVESDEEVRQVMQGLLNNSDSTVAGAARQALGLNTPEESQPVRAVQDEGKEEAPSPASKAGAREPGEAGPLPAEEQERLLAQLESDVRIERVRAVRQLGAYAGSDLRVRAALLQRLQDPRRRVRSAAVRALGGLAGVDDEVLAALVACLGDRSAEVIEEAGKYLQAAAQQDAAMLARLADWPEDVGQAVLINHTALLGRLFKHPPARRKLLQRITHADPLVRQTAAAALRVLAESDLEARRALLERLAGDENAHVRWNAVRMLGGLAVSDVEVREALAARAESDEDQDVREAAQEALGVASRMGEPAQLEEQKGAGPPAAEDPLTQLLDQMKRAPSGSTAAGEKLVQMARKDAAARQELLERVKSHPDAGTREDAAWVIAKAADPAAVRALVNLQRDEEDESVRKLIRGFLFLISAMEPALEQALLGLMEDEDPFVRGYAVNTFGLGENRLAKKEAVRRAVEGRLNDPDPRVREAARKALDMLPPLPLEVRTPEVVEQAFASLPAVRQEVAREMHVTYYNQIKSDMTERAREIQERNLTVLDLHFHLSRDEVDRRIKESLENRLALPAAGGQEFSRYHVTMLLHRSSAAADPYEGDFCIGSFAPFRHAETGGGDYGQALYRDLFHNQPAPEGQRIASARAPSDLVAGLKSTLREIEREQKKLNITIRVDEQAPELHDFQWEYLCAPGEVPLACRPDTPFARYLMRAPVSTSVLKTGAASPLRMLLALASPLELKNGAARDFALRGLKELPAGQVYDLAALLAGQPGVDIPAGHVLERGKGAGVSLQALEDALARAEAAGQPVHILHLACHGLADYNGLPAVVLETPDGQSAQVVPDRKLAAMVAAHTQRGLKLVVLAACHTARVAGLGGVARALINQGVPAVVAMQGAVSYAALQVFCGSLYAELLATGCIDQAVNRARRALLLAGQGHAADRATGIGPHEWGLPVLFSGLQDGRLLEPASEGDRQAFQQAAAAPREARPLSAEHARRMAEEEVRERLGMISASLGIDFSPLVQAMHSAPIRVEMVEREEARAALPGLFRGEPEREQRWKLVRAACGHRMNRLRRATLFLREQARAEIARLVAANAVGKLTFDDFKEQIWSPGFVNLGGAVEACEAPDRSRWQGFRHLAKVYRQQQRALAGQRTLAQAAAGPFLRGNLTWFDSPLRRLPEAASAAELQTRNDHLLEALRELLGRAEDALSTPRPELADQAQRTFFEAFEAATGGDSGLDPATTSLALHARWPKTFAPYDPQVASAVLDLWEIPAGSPYRAGYGGYCRLALDLCADGELGFTGLADVNFFFQRLEANPGQWQRASAPPERLRVPLQDEMDLPVDALDSGLVIDPKVMPRAAAALKTGKHIILIGPPGTGKTTLAEDLCSLAYDMNCSRGHILVTATADWTTFDTIGGYMPVKGGGLVFRPGIFLEAIHQEKWLVIDEINRADIDKSFGELFTVLSGQAVTLPYQVNGQPVRILPPGSVETGLESDYVIHPHWRIIGTMNVYDKASLFAMSYAFMRRFAFIDVDLPRWEDYRTLLHYFLRQQGIDLSGLPQIEAGLEAIFKTEQETSEKKAPANPLMHWRASGPAIAKDMVAYLGQRAAGGEPLSEEHLAEALLLYVVPQFDGLEQSSIKSIYSHLQDELLKGQAHIVLRRIQELFPYISEWPGPKQ